MVKEAGEVELEEELFVEYPKMRQGKIVRFFRQKVFGYELWQVLIFGLVSLAVLIAIIYIISIYW